ncbi:MAG TPA: hypothetical protein VHC44_06875 [Verrucomicrobiae bacterium]|nr:hypothetical protein [Verrucomicrobiae bacterium]
MNFDSLTNQKISPDKNQILPQEGSGLGLDAGEVKPLRILPWQLERAKRLHRICRCIEGRVSRGEKLRKAFTWFVWRWNGRPFRCDPVRKLKLKKQTLRDWYYIWKKNGRNEAALTLKYRSSRPQRDRTKVTEFLRICVESNCDSFHSAHALMKDSSVTDSAYYHALPPRLAKQVNELFTHRRRVRFAHRRLARAVEKFFQ